MWIQVLLDSNLAHVAKGVHPKIYYTLDLITDLDPLNFEAYDAGANLLSIIRDDQPGARDLLEKGNRFRQEKLASYPVSIRENYWRYSWDIPLLLSYVYLFELQDLPSAAQAIEQASEIQGAPPYLMNMKKRLENPGGEYEVGLRLLNFMIQGEKNPNAREDLVKRRQSLFVGQFLFDLNRSFRNFLLIRHRASPTPSDLVAYLKESRTSIRDPWGGLLTLSSEGKIVTTTPHDRVFGLD
jgi:hypothetical protein